VCFYIHTLTDYVYNKTIRKALKTHASAGSTESYKKVSQSHLDSSGLAREVRDYQQYIWRNVGLPRRGGKLVLETERAKKKKDPLQVDDHNDDDENDTQNTGCN
jgi:hypothetical protein